MSVMQFVWVWLVVLLLPPLTNAAMSALLLNVTKHRSHIQRLVEHIAASIWKRPIVTSDFLPKRPKRPECSAWLVVASTILFSVNNCLNKVWLSDGLKAAPDSAMTSWSWCRWGWWWWWWWWWWWCWWDLEDEKMLLLIMMKKRDDDDDKMMMMMMMMMMMILRCG